MQVRENIGLNFAAALRSFLRQDPNIILVGEIRDFETAEIAVKAALTGHLVLSTLHTNDAPSTVNRLMNMGIEPFLVASSRQPDLRAAPRAPRLQPTARSRSRTPPQALMQAGFSPEDAQHGRRRCKGKGCDKCNNTGYKGRVGLYEVMEITDELRELILVGASALELRRKAIEEGMITLRSSGLRKVKAGRDDDRRSGRGDREVAESQGQTVPGPCDLTRTTWRSTLPELLKTTVELGGSDLHLTTSTPPQVRVHGKLQRLEHADLTPADTKQLAYSVLTDAQKKRFEETLELDFSFGIKGLARFRCNMFNQRGAVGAVYRLIPERIRTLRGARPAAGARQAGRAAARPGAGHRPDRQRQVDDARRDDRQDQHRAARAHPHHRGSDRVPAPAQGLPGQPARGAQRHAELLATRCARRCARTPTSCSSARCATSRRSRRRCASPRPAT